MTFTVLIEKKWKYLIKMEKKLQQLYPNNYILFIAKDLWEAYYQILLLILLKEFIKSNLNTDTMIKNVKLEELDIKIATAF